MKLTIGMAHHSDWEGLHSTIQSLAIHHHLKDSAELVVVDNTPDSHAGGMVKNLVGTWPKGKYVPLPESIGTSVPRDRIFREATGDFVLVMDCHVLLPVGAIGSLLSWFERNPGSPDIVTGPLFYDSLDNWSTHFDEQWRSEMWGTWGQSWRCLCGETFSVINKLLGWVHYLTMSSPQREIVQCEACHRPFPEVLPWPGHEEIMTAKGYYRIGQSVTEPAFEIPGQGLGLFACRRGAWVGFHPDARGFGGEELWVHDKFRKAGGKAICLPALRWNHRFGRTHNLQYPLSRYGKVRNYVLEFLQTGLSLDPIYKHFISLDLPNDGMPLAYHLVAEHGANPEDVKDKSEEELAKLHASYKLTKEVWEYLLADPVKHERMPGQALPVVQAQSGTGPTIDEIYSQVKSVPRDLNEHFPWIRDTVSKVAHVTAIVKRCEWDAAVLAGRPEVYISHNSEFTNLQQLLHQAVKSAQSNGRPKTKEYTTHQKTLEELPSVEIEPTDLLILDTVHSADRVQLELQKHATKVRRWILVRGTAAFGLKAESGGGPGLEQGIGEFIATHKQWKRVWFAGQQYGMTLLGCDPNERSIDLGPGTELHKILESIGINPSVACDCRAKTRQMDVWGPQGCRENKLTIVQWMREGLPRWGWTSKLKAAALAVTTGLAFVLDWDDPFPSMIEEAIRRSEAVEAEIGV